MAKDLTPEITAEIRRVLERFDISIDADFDLTETSKVNRILESRGADIYLLCTIGSWRDTLPDEVILDELQTWNSGKSLAPDIPFARTQRSS